MTEAVTDKRRAILQATLDLTVERGFHDTPMSQIAKRAGVSAGIIYHYFTNKDDLIHALYRDIKQQFGGALPIDDMRTMPFPQQLKYIWIRAYRFYVAHPNETRFLEQYESSPYRQAFGVADYDENARALHQMAQAGYEKQLLKDIPPDALYEMTFRVAINLARRQVEGHIDLDDATVDMIADALCGAVLV